MIKYEVYFKNATTQLEPPTVSHGPVRPLPLAQSMR